MSAPMVCPRRAEAPLPTPLGIQDAWANDRGVKTCTYCGSMHPEEFLIMAAAGAKLTPTDKSYKVYIELPNPEEGKRIVTSAMSGPAFNAFTGAPALPDLTLVERLLGRYSRKTYGVAPATMTQKVYFQHFDESQQVRFINLMNTGGLEMAFPGHFYVRPFFVRQAEERG